MPTRADSCSSSGRTSNVTRSQKFNLVYYGLDECPQGTHYVDRSIRDSGVIHSVMRALDFCPRPLLVKFNEVGDVMSILAKRKNLSQSHPQVIIKPDMTQEQREIEYVLLKERKMLIDSGTHRKDIRIRGSRLLWARGYLVLLITIPLSSIQPWLTLSPPLLTTPQLQ